MPSSAPSDNPLSLALYVLKKELHRSGSGAVFEATELASGRHVAIKRKDTPELGDRKLIAHEALLLETLSHPNVAVCLGSFVERGSFTQSSIGTIVSVYLPRLHLLQQKM